MTAIHSRFRLQPYHVACRLRYLLEYSVLVLLVVFRYVVFECNPLNSNAVGDSAQADSRLHGCLRQAGDATDMLFDS